MKTKFYWHIHHNILLEPLTDPLKTRIDYIKQKKPTNEIAVRLKLLAAVKSVLPAEVIKVGKTYVAEDKKYRKIEKECDKAATIFFKTNCESAKAYKKSHLVYRKAMDINEKAWCTVVNARDDFIKVLKHNSTEINILHKKECPHCPWNGTTIFPNKN